jgi:hypothetical protein
MQVLVVRDAFADFAVGTIIRDHAAIQAVRDADQAHFCTPTDIDESFFAGEPAGAQDAASAAKAPEKAKPAPTAPADPAAAPSAPDAA